MNRNLAPKLILVLVLVVAAALTLFPPSKTLKPGIDLAGGTSLIYAIDTEGLGPEEEKDLAQKMITVLRRRIDPANIQNLVWRPQGNTRFEIQMPLASQETRLKREEYEAALNALLEKNVNPATIMRALLLDEDKRKEAFAEFAQGDPNRLEILQDLASVHDERKPLQEKRDALYQELGTLKQELSTAGVDLDRVEANRGDWSKLDSEALGNELTDFLGSEEQLEPLTRYVKAYAELAEALDRLTAESGLNERYEEVKRRLDRLNLTREQINYVLELSPKSAQRAKRIEELRERFPDREPDILQVLEAYDGYRPHRGRLDDPQDLRRMLKGAGILEFRILPTADSPGLSAAEIERYQETLAEKGPKAASDNRYVWVQIESIEDWNVRASIVGQFGETFYVLASNQPNDAMLHGPGGREWKLENAYPTTDEMGRRAIGFTLDIRGGNLFYNITSRHGGEPLAILLDKIAISAPEINPERPIRERGVITGSFTQTEVTDMVNKLNAGSLPARLIEQPISEKIIGPSIGADNRDKGIVAGIIGLIIVMVIMLGYYLLVGAIADVALLLNLLFILAIMAGIRATFTLPGIAGMILTIGMSVDANVLIYERIREELQKGAGLATAIRNGYQRAFRAIFDSNLTTFITAAILYWRASEDVKGFAIVLMIGIASSMFTALFVTRMVLDFLVSRGILKNRLVMLRLIHEPNVNWMGARKVFFVISGILIVAGLTIFFTRNDAANNKYDIEFTGGTSVQINLKEDVTLSRQDVVDRIVDIGRTTGNPALQAANVYSIGKSGLQYEITTTATNRTSAAVTFGQDGPQTVDAVAAAIRKAQAKLNRELGDLKVAPNGDRSFTVSTSRINPTLVTNVLKEAFPNAEIARPEVDEVVTSAIRDAFEGLLEVQQNLRPKIASIDRITDQVVEIYPELTEYLGGIRIQVAIESPASLGAIDRRLKDLQFKPDMQNLTWYTYEVFGRDVKQIDPNIPVSAFDYVSVAPEAGLRQLSEEDEEWQRYIGNEEARVLAAAEMETSLPRVTQIDPFIGSEQKTRALVAIVLSLSAIVGYVWLRFGSARYGLAAIAALVHDVTITGGAVVACTYIAGTVIGDALLIQDFKINLAMIAAFLTLIGYSLNDTIVVFDRIRENRRKAQLTPQTITNSINQTISRTIMTSVTTFVVVLIMYIFGGPGLRGFTFAIGFGIIIGTYSSVAIAAPLLLIGRKSDQGKTKTTGGKESARAKPKLKV